MKQYASIPRQVRPYLPALYDTLKVYGVRVSPYRVIAEAFDASPSRVQQIILAERGKEREAESAESRPVQAAGE